MKENEKGIFIISLDFELNWGVHDVFTNNQYRDNLAGTRKAIDEMLRLFEKYNIHVTWATVGMLFFDSKEQLIQYLPREKPTYENPSFSPYGKLDKIGNNEGEDPFHFGASIIKKISTYPGQEIATHTFSHYYCLEKGQTAEEFEADIKMAVKVAQENNHSVKSIVFPRNQLNNKYLSICKRHGIQSYRGNQSGWIYRESQFHKESLIKRMVRLLDGYVDLTGHHTYPIRKVDREAILNLPASHFLRPYVQRFNKLEKLKLRRIKRGILHAANRGEVYHLWWHPHNFGKNIEENIQFLNGILQYVNEFVEKGQLTSMNMEEVSKMVPTRETEKVPKYIHPNSQYEM